MAPKKRHHLAWTALDGTATARVESILDEIGRLSRVLVNAWFPAWPSLPIVGETHETA